MPFRPFSRLFELYFGNRFLSPTPGEQFRAFQRVQGEEKGTESCRFPQNVCFSHYIRRKGRYIKLDLFVGGVGTFRRVWACPDTGQTILFPPICRFWMCR
ncbi:hypothetical protein CEXT_503541 [Caerostris extrusa]|uniref:Uncharacterized protein n=1 Tax=Caerostris extrusa TaxID=172846 RepID=A0AAV4VRL5_CAEEX|nr:hypothetical protein CEXT_503541 [Caerostris extrusa]